MRADRRREAAELAALKKAQEEAFAQEYIVDYSAMAAAIRAGYAYSTAKNASKWIDRDHPTKPHVLRRIDELTMMKHRRLGVTQKRVIELIAAVAFCEPGKLIDFETGKVRPDAAPEDLAAIAGIKIAGGRKPVREVRLHDRLHAAELLGKHLGIFDDKARREQGEQASVNRVAEIMARLDAESAGPPEGCAEGTQGAPPLDPAQGTDSPENPALASGGVTGGATDGTAGGDGRC